MDSDSNFGDGIDEVSTFSWDVYHIENYLLSNEHIAMAINSLSIGERFNPDDIEVALIEAARLVVPEIVNHRLKRRIFEILRPLVQFGYDPKYRPRSEAIKSRLSQISEGIASGIKSEMHIDSIAATESQIEQEMSEALENGKWRKIIPGRDIMRQMLRERKLGIQYESFRNIVINKMVDTGYQPEPMKNIIEKIVTS